MLLLRLDHERMMLALLIDCVKSELWLTHLRNLLHFPFESIRLSEYGG